MNFVIGLSRSSRQGRFSIAPATKSAVSARHRSQTLAHLAPQLKDRLAHIADTW